MIAESKIRNFTQSTTQRQADRKIEYYKKGTDRQTKQYKKDRQKDRQNGWQKNGYSKERCTGDMNRTSTYSHGEHFHIKSLSNKLS